MGEWKGNRFSNGQLELSLETPVCGRACAVLASVSPPDDNLVSLLFLCDTLFRAGASEVKLVLPYLAYSRQDRDEPGKSRAAGLLGSLFQAAHATSVVTIDIHSERAAALMPLPIANLSSASLFASAIRRDGLDSATIVAPDHGAIGRCEAVRALIPGSPALVSFAKTRHGERVESKLEGKIGESAVIIDDILDSGATLLTAAEQLRAAGAKEITIMITHGIFSGELWKGLFERGVKTIYSSDSIPSGSRKGVTVLNSAPLLAEYLAALAR